MTNKNEAWRLEDENGKKVGKKLTGDIKMFFNGEEVGTMQSITLTNGSMLSHHPYTIGSDLPTEYTVPIRGEGYQRFQQEYLGHWGDINTAPVVRYRTIDMQIPDIEDMMWREMMEYQELINGRPEYLSLSKLAYESFWLTARRYEMPSRSLNPTRFRGIEVICNPLQEQHVLALGGPEQEMQRSLYDEQS